MAPTLPIPGKQRGEMRVEVMLFLQESWDRNLAAVAKKLNAVIRTMA